MLESIQERALKIIFSNKDYPKNLKSANLTTLKDHRLKLCKSLFSQAQHSNHRLNHLLPVVRHLDYEMR